MERDHDGKQENKHQIKAIKMQSEKKKKKTIQVGDRTKENGERRKEKLKLYKSV